MERLRRLSIKTPGRITTISHHAGNKQGQSDILNFPQKGPIWSWKCAGEILPPNYWGGVCCFVFFFMQSFTELMIFHFKKWLSELMTSRLMACWRKSWVMQFALGEREKCVCDAGQERPATSAVSGETINRYRETSKMFVSQVFLKCFGQMLIPGKYQPIVLYLILICIHRINT